MAEEKENWQVLVFADEDEINLVDSWNEFQKTQSEISTEIENDPRVKNKTWRIVRRRQYEIRR